MGRSMGRSVERSVGRLVDSTPPSRARDVDFLRLASVCVVVLWHWALSIDHFRGGVLVMPNPIARIPFAWLATWLLQVMPVFFVIGGFAHLAAWDAAGRATGSPRDDPARPWGPRARRFLRGRLRRLLPPMAVFAVVWAAVDAVLLLALPDYPGLLRYGRAVLVPLWFLAAYLGVILVVPVTAAVHRRFGRRFILLLGAVVALVDLARFGTGSTVFGYVNTGLVWVFAHQLGYFWRDGVLRGPRRALLTALCGLAGLALVTTLDEYPRSMVATEGARRGNMFPTTAAIAVLAVFQLGLILLAAPALNRMLARRRPWTAVVTGNAVIMTVFLWHMTALLLAMVTMRAVGLPMPDEPTATWWAGRPLWVILPALFLAPLIVLFAPVERGAAAPRGPARTGPDD
ncbi:hypothetical protein CcI6DRAFT_03189 [Frankia sp. CcI6]|nr:hypothetical protein CcI6DRAFT_03189 [Frankia sp. CcI6]OAA23065.1 acyltransferase family protein [Frankia casuarinae]